MNMPIDQSGLRLSAGPDVALSATGQISNLAELSLDQQRQVRDQILVESTKPLTVAIMGHAMLLRGRQNCHRSRAGLGAAAHELVWCRHRLSFDSCRVVRGTCYPCGCGR